MAYQEYLEGWLPWVWQTREILGSFLPNCFKLLNRLGVVMEKMQGGFQEFLLLLPSSVWQDWEVFLPLSISMFESSSSLRFRTAWMDDTLSSLQKAFFQLESMRSMQFQKASFLLQATKYPLWDNGRLCPCTSPPSSLTPPSASAQASSLSLSTKFLFVPTPPKISSLIR